MWSLTRGHRHTLFNSNYLNRTAIQVTQWTGKSESRFQICGKHFPPRHRSCDAAHAQCLQTHPQWYSMGNIRTHNSRTDSHKISKLGGAVEYYYYVYCEVVVYKLTFILCTLLILVKLVNWLFDWPTAFILLERSTQYDTDIKQTTGTGCQWGTKCLSILAACTT